MQFVDGGVVRFLIYTSCFQTTWGEHMMKFLRYEWIFKLLVLGKSKWSGYPSMTVQDIITATSVFLLNDHPLCCNFRSRYDEKKQKTLWMAGIIRWLVRRSPCTSRLASPREGDVILPGGRRGSFPTPNIALFLRFRKPSILGTWNCWW